MSFAEKLVAGLRSRLKRSRSVGPEQSVPSMKAAPPASASEDEPELVAVITAAIAACMERLPDEIRVRSIRELTGNRPLWALFGRQRQMQDRL
jgi:hypothetical protein